MKILVKKSDLENLLKSIDELRANSLINQKVKASKTFCEKLLQVFQDEIKGGEWV